MSCYEWERGEIRIPAGEWASVKRAVREAHNELRERTWRLACEVHERTLAAIKSKRGVNVRDAMARTLTEIVCERGGGGPHGVDWEYMGPAGVDMADVMDTIYPLRFVHPQAPQYGPTERPGKPKKRFLPHARATNRAKSIHLGEACIVFEDEARILRWEVPENNHACDRARAHPVGRALFERLEQVRWTRNTGGVIWGGNEFTEQGAMEYPGGGGSQIRRVFGPRGEALQKEVLGLS